MDLGIAGKRAIVCGASRGIGFAVAFRLAQEGAEVALVARHQKGLEEAASRIEDSCGVTVNAVPADLTTEEGREKVGTMWPRTEILITNPGVPQRPADFSSLSRAEWNWWFEAHFFSALELIRHYLPAMKIARFGRVVNISVSFIKFPQENAGHSHGARLALAGAIASVAREAISHNVTINSVLPGLTDTDALRDAVTARTNMIFEKAREKLVEGCPAGRLATPEEIADLVVMLTASQLGFVTAQNIVADGGIYQGLF